MSQQLSKNQEGHWGDNRDGRVERFEESVCFQGWCGHDDKYLSYIIYMCVCVHTCMYIYIHTYIYMHIYVFKFYLRPHTVLIALRFVATFESRFQSLQPEWPSVLTDEPGPCSCHAP